MRYHKIVCISCSAIITMRLHMLIVRTGEGRSATEDGNEQKHLVAVMCLQVQRCISESGENANDAVFQAEQKKKSRKYIQCV